MKYRRWRRNCWPGDRHQGRWDMTGKTIRGDVATVTVYPKEAGRSPTMWMYPNGYDATVLSGVPLEQLAVKILKGFGWEITQ